MLFIEIGTVDELWYRPGFLSLTEIDGILAFVVATGTLWGNEKEAGAISLHVVNMIHRIILVFSSLGD
jgi:hypothetical protein